MIDLTPLGHASVAGPPRTRAAVLLLAAAVCCSLCARAAPPPVSVSQKAVVFEAERPASQQGSRGEDKKTAASGGQVLGQDWGTVPGHFAEYVFDVPQTLAPARIGVRYARQIAGASRLNVSLDNRPVGVLVCATTGGWGDAPEQLRDVSLALPRLAAGRHRLRLTVAAAPSRSPLSIREARLNPHPVLDRVGNRPDKNSVGAGNNVALYTGQPSRFFFATHELGNVFSAADGQTLAWYPDHVVVSPQLPASAPGNVNLDTITVGPAGAQIRARETAAAAAAAPPVLEQRQVCVTPNDVIVSRVRLTNTTNAPRTHTLIVAGDCRPSFDWRGRPGGEKQTRRDGNTVFLVDKNVFPNILPGGLVMAVGASVKPTAVDTATPGAYQMTFAVFVPANGSASVTFACAVARDENAARANLAKTLAQPDPLQANRDRWRRFYEQDVPQFECSDAGLTELYAFRWFLLKFSTAGGDLGLFKYPVVMEGRQAFQTYCCYSAPFMAFDLNWHADPAVGWGHLANMVHVAYEDGRFPWYTSPRTNDVPLDHPSKTGLSLLQWTAWRWYQTHGDKAKLAEIYPGLVKNLDWWIKDRDPDRNGLFLIDHQLETGMDDLYRRWKTGKSPTYRYEAVDATVYACLNLQAVANAARELNKTADARRYGEYAERAARALRTLAWDAKRARFEDRDPATGERTDYNSICIFYPLLLESGVLDKASLGALARRYLLSPAEYRTAHPIPALSQTDPDFDPVRGYWRGPSWPAANSHVVEGFATAAKRFDRSLLPDAGALLFAAARNHLQPRPDFYERYDPFSGRPLSSFRDYMHSWWVDVFLRHAAGLTPQNDGSLIIDPLPLNLTYFALRGAPHRGRKVDVLWSAAGTDKGLTVRVNGRTVRRDPDFRPGTSAPVVVRAEEVGAR